MQTQTQPTRHLLDRETGNVKPQVEEYVGLHDGNVEDRKRQYTTLVNHYYDLVTDFYEFGWGQSFHFAPRMRAESFDDSLARHERFLVRELGLKPGMRVLDVGCGVGGPMREIARASGARVVGLNNNAYQIERGMKHTCRAGLTQLCSFVKGDFMDIPATDGAFDAVYAIEATCHAPDKTALFREIARVMKPGTGFAGYEWCLTDRFDKTDARHEEIRRSIERGNGLPELAFTHEVDDALRAAGFEVVEARDIAPTSDPETPWYLPLAGNELSLRSLPRTPVGRKVTHVATRVLELVRLAPKGTTEISSFLNRGADALVAGGVEGIFTPMYYFHARKPA